MKEKIEIERLEERLQKYCRCTEVALGDLYLYEFSNKKRIPFYYPSIAAIEKHSGILCGGKFGNVHMVPYDIELAELCADIVHEKYKRIGEYIEEEIKKNYDGKIISKGTDPGKISILNETDYEKANYLFSYLSVSCNNTKYDLVFNRFFKDESNQINCILLCFQIKMYNKNKTEPPSIKNYPHTPYNEEGNATYYNFGADILYSSDQEIAEKFLKFVWNNETKKDS